MSENLQDIKSIEGLLSSESRALLMYPSPVKMYESIANDCLQGVTYSLIKFKMSINRYIAKMIELTVLTLAACVFIYGLGMRFLMYPIGGVIAGLFVRNFSTLVLSCRQSIKIKKCFRRALKDFGTYKFGKYIEKYHSLIPSLGVMWTFKMSDGEMNIVVDDKNAEVLCSGKNVETGTGDDIGCKLSFADFSNIAVTDFNSSLTIKHKEGSEISNNVSVTTILEENNIGALMDMENGSLRLILDAKGDRLNVIGEKLSKGTFGVSTILDTNIFVERFDLFNKTGKKIKFRRADKM